MPKTLCPLLMAAILASARRYTHDTKEANCLREDCSWWQPPNPYRDFGECSIKGIANELEDFRVGGVRVNY